MFKVGLLEASSGCLDRAIQNDSETKKCLARVVKIMLYTSAFAGGQIFHNAKSDANTNGQPQKSDHALNITSLLLFHFLRMLRRLQSEIFKTKLSN